VAKPATGKFAGRPFGLFERRHAGVPPDAAASVLVDDYWAFCRFSRNLVAPSLAI
jgi:hypothetical protein